MPRNRHASKRRLLIGAMLTMALAIQPGVFTALAADGDTTLQGTLTVIRGDGPPGSGTVMTRHLLDTSDRTVELEVPSGLDASQYDRDAVSVQGQYEPDGDFAVSSMSSSTQASAFASEDPHGPPTTGAQPWGTLLCQFNDRPTTDENLAFFQDLMGSTVPGMDHYWRELSYDKANLDGSEEYDWQTMVDDRSEYFDGDGDAKLTKLAQDCVDAHDASVDFSLYDGLNFMFNDGIGCCAWGGGRTLNTGEGTLGFHTTWMPPWAYHQQGVFGQEMGHGFGLPHSSGPYEATYDSRWDVMSDARGTCANAPFSPDPDYGCLGTHTISAFKDLLGWIDTGDKYTWDGVTDNVQVELTRLAQPPTQTNPGGEIPYLMAELPIPGTDDFYTIEARKFAGYDAEVPGEGVVIHHVDYDRDDRDAQVVDGSDNSDPNDDGAMWLPGEKYEDTENGISILVLTETTNGFVVVINPTPVADIEVTKTARTDPAIAGDQLYYDVTVVNHGPGTSQDVVITDTLPDEVTYVTDTGGCTESSGVVTCEVGQLEDGESETITILVDVDEDVVADNGGPTTLANVVEVVQSEEIEDPDVGNNTFTLTTIVDDRANLALHKDCKPDRPLSAGETATCTIVVDNLGPSAARDVRVVDEIVADGPFTVESADATPGFCSTSTSTNAATVNCSLGDLPTGTSVGTVIVKVSSDEGVDINDVATVSTDTHDPDASNDSASDTVVVQAEADLSVVKTDDVDPVTAGEDVTWIITTANNGPSTAEAVKVRDFVPAGVTITSVSTTRGSCTVGVAGDAARPTVCTIGDLAPGQNAVVTVVAHVLPDTRGLLRNDATVSSATVDPDTGDNSATEDTTVEAQADLVASKDATPDPVIAGDVVTFDVTITNDGPSTAFDVGFDDDLFQSYEFLSATTVQAGSCTLVDGGATSGPSYDDLVSCDFDALLAPGSSVQARIDVRLDPSELEGGSIANTAVPRSSTPGNRVNDSAIVNVIARADLQLLMDSNFETGNASTTIIYTIDVTNLGLSDAQEVVITDDLPSDANKKGDDRIEFVFATEGCTYTPNDTSTNTPHFVTCDVGTLAAGATATVEIHIQAKGNVDGLENYAEVESLTTIDPDPSNNADTELVSVGGGDDKGGGPGGGRGKNK